MTVDPHWLTKVLLGLPTPETHRECRHCGTTVDNDTDTCPDCGTPEIASYRLSG